MAELNRNNKTKSLKYFLMTTKKLKAGKSPPFLRRKRVLIEFVEGRTAVRAALAVISARAVLTVSAIVGVGV